MNRNSPKTWLSVILILLGFGIFYWGSISANPTDLFLEKARIYKYLDDNSTEFVRCRNSLQLGKAEFGNLILDLTTRENAIRLSEIQTEFNEKIESECSELVETYRANIEEYKTVSADYANQSQNNFEKTILSRTYAPSDYDGFNEYGLVASEGGLMNFRYSKDEMTQFINERL